MEVGRQIVNEVWCIFLDLAPFLLFAFLLSGIIFLFIPRVFVRKAFGTPGFTSVLRASLFGIPLPLCSCSVIPTAISLRQQGASKGSTLAFLITTPESGIDSITVSAGFLDPLMTALRPIAAGVTGLFAGVAEDYLDKAQTVNPAPEEKCKICGAGFDVEHIHSIWEKLRAALQYGYQELFDNIIIWILIGIVLAAVIAVLLPPGSVAATYQGEAVQFFAMIVIGVPVYICATASTPMAASLILAGISPGAALVLLLVGPATNIATILTVWHEIGKRAAAIYLGSIILVSVIFGIFLNRLYEWLLINPTASIGALRDWFPYELKIAAAILFIGLMVSSLGRKLRKKKRIYSCCD